jgi:4-methyl-5(b-hydroxyethyl)-thiazole monophosphate biosynthesis
MPPTSDMKRVLCLLGPGFEEIETVAPIDLLRRAGAEVVVASLHGEEWVTGRSALTLKADAALSEIDTEKFDLLFIPGGPGVLGLRKDGRAARLAKGFFERQKPVAAICAGPAVLGDAGLLDGKKFTAHFSVHAELPGARADERVVRDGLVITSRGAGTAVDFGLALVAELFGSGKAEEIATSIMA